MNFKKNPKQLTILREIGLFLSRAQEKLIGLTAMRD